MIGLQDTGLSTGVDESAAEQSVHAIALRIRMLDGCIRDLVSQHQVGLLTPTPVTYWFLAVINCQCLNPARNAARNSLCNRACTQHLQQVLTFPGTCVRDCYMLSFLSELKN